MGAARLVLLTGAMIFASLVWDVAALDRVIVAVVVILAISWLWNKVSLTGLGVERTLLLDRINVGDVVTEQVNLTNHSRLPKLWVEMLDYSTLPNHAISKVLYVPGKRTRSWELQTIATRRGRFRLGPSRLVASDPLALFRSEVAIPVSHNVIVFPARVDISSIKMPVASLAGGVMLPRTSMMSSATVSSVRDYTPGDPMNRIAWSATARRGQLMVKEFDPDPTADLWLLLDLNESGVHAIATRSGAADARRYLDSTAEFVVSIGASLANAALEQGRKVGVIINRDKPVRIDPDNSERQWFRIAETLAVVQPGGSRSVSDTITANHRQFSRTSGLIVVSADTNGDWVGAAAALIERLVPVTAVIVDANSAEQGSVDPLIRRLATARVGVNRYGVNGEGAT